MHLTFYLATAADADTLIGFSRSAADSKIYFRPADAQVAQADLMCLEMIPGRFIGFSISVAQLGG